MNFYSAMDMLYLNYCSIKKNNTKLGIKEDKILIEEIIKNAKYVIKKGGSYSIVKEYLETIFNGHKVLLIGVLNQLNEIRNS